jgi:uncharacterized protein YcbX
MANERSNPLGTVVAIWRYPVKSMMGEELNAAEVTERGVLGDRAYALVDPESGNVVSAKNPRKWSGMFDSRASFVTPPQERDSHPEVWIALPDGSLVWSGDSDVDEHISARFGRRVRLVSSPLGAHKIDMYWPDIDGLAQRDTVTVERIQGTSFFDGAEVHLLTTATLARLTELYAGGRFEARRFRPNFVIATPPDVTGFVENDWHGETLALGDAVRLRITGPCPRCVMTTLPQGDLPKDPGILRTAVQHNGGHVGIYATVESGGTVRRSDTVRLA